MFAGDVVYLGTPPLLIQSVSLLQHPKTSTYLYGSGLRLKGSSTSDIQLALG